MDAKFSPMRVARCVREQVPENSVHEPRRRVAILRDLFESDLQFVEGIVAGFIHARMLTGRADEQSREEERQGRMILPISEQAAQEVGAPQEGAVRRGWTAQNNMIAAACANVASINEKLLRSKPCQAGFVVEDSRIPDQMIPGC